jgi:hypothetical protein
MKSQMLKYLVWMAVLLQIVITQTKWVVVEVENGSDAVITCAARHDKAVIPSISRLFQGMDPIIKQPNKVSIPSQALFGSDGQCKLMLQTPQGDRVAFCFLGDPVFKVCQGRVDYPNLQSRNAAADLKEPMMARVVLVCDGNGNCEPVLIGHLGYDFVETPKPLGVKIMGSQGQYAAVLYPV